MRADKKYNIPKKFYMGGQEIKVEVKKDIGIPGAIGVFYFNRNLIQVQTHQDGHPMPTSQVEQTLYHEVCHCLLEHCRFDELSYNEHLVDLMGEFIYQSIGKVIKW